MKKPCMLLPIVAILICRSAALAKNEVELDKPIDFANAGIQMAFPVGQKPELSRTINCLFYAVERQDKKPFWRSCSSLCAYCYKEGDEKKSLKDTAQMVTAEHGILETYKSTTILCSEAVKVAEYEGWRVVSLLDGENGKETATVTVWQVNFGEQKFVMQYALLTKVAGGDINQLESVTDAVCGTYKKIPVISLSKVDLSEPVIPAELHGEGFFIKVPVGWYVSKMRRTRGNNIVFDCAAADYLNLARQPSMNVVVIKLPEKPDFSSEEFVENHIKDIARAMTDMKWECKSHSIVQVDGHDALQTVSSLVYDGKRETQVQIFTWNEEKAYFMTVTYLGEDAKLATAAMERFVRVFEFGVKVQCDKCGHIYQVKKKSGEDGKATRHVCPYCGHEQPEATSQPDREEKKPD